MKEIDVFDFDKTLIPFDSGSRFWLFCLVHNPWIVFCLPYQVAVMLLYIIGIKDLTFAKGRFFCFVRFINLEKNVTKFWDKYEETVFDWFKNEDRERPAVVISASPDFLLNEICSRLNVYKLICTVHNPKNGRIIGKNCKREEKIRRFNEEVGRCRVVNVCSDSLKSDKWIFSMGENCFHIQKNGERVPFIYNEIYKD